MDLSLKEVENKALQLSASERGELIAVLIASLEGEMQASPEEIAAAWDAEIERRVADVEAGRANFVDADEALRTLRALADQRRPK
jgi:putative addiction module component (TIGR02574 family)